jgi:hypothetical protein
VLGGGGQLAGALGVVLPRQAADSPHGTSIHVCPLRDTTPYTHAPASCIA